MVNGVSGALSVVNAVFLKRLRCLRFAFVF